MAVPFALLFTASSPATPQAVFKTKESSSAYAAINYNKKVQWRCVAVPTRASEGDEGG
jgi:hypothetical protein